MPWHEKLAEVQWSEGGVGTLGPRERCLHPDSTQGAARAFPGLDSLCVARWEARGLEGLATGRVHCHRLAWYELSLPAPQSCWLVLYLQEALRGIYGVEHAAMVAATFALHPCSKHLGTSGIGESGAAGHGSFLPPPDSKVLGRSRPCFARGLHEGLWCRSVTKTLDTKHTSS